jgi:hypothetical protein
VDSVVREPSNVVAENSIDPFLSHQVRTELKREVNDYSEVTGVKTVDENTTDGRLAALECEHTLLHKKVDKLNHKLQNAVTCNTLSLPSSSGKGVMTRQISAPTRICSVDDRLIDVCRNLTHLIKDIHCVPLSDKLFEREIITINEHQEIATESTPDAGNRKLLLIIRKKRVMKSKMDEILDETEQKHLKDLF